MTLRTTRLLFLALTFLTLSGCKLILIATPGGSITSLSNERNCSATFLCGFEVTDPNFGDTFTAVPAQGYEFVRWQKSEGFQCGDSTLPTCSIQLKGRPVDILAVASYNSLYVMAVFSKLEDEK